MLRNHPMVCVLLVAIIGFVASAGNAHAQQNPPSLQSDKLPSAPSIVAEDEHDEHAAHGEHAADKTNAADEDTPSSAIIVLPPGTRPPGDMNDNPAARARIADMLQRAQQNLGLHEQARASSNQSHSTDPILNDVLDVIRQRGSVLDGSSLDETPHAEMQPHAHDAAYPQPPRMSDADRRYQVAESLLRSARLLQQLGASDPEQAQLIQSMRQRALKLMIQSAAHDPQPYGTQGH